MLKSPKTNTVENGLIERSSYMLDESNKNCAHKNLRSPNSYFGYSGHVWALPSKTIMPTCGHFNVCLYENVFFWYCKDVANLLLWVRWECLIMSINNDSITVYNNLMSKVLKSNCRKLSCLSACKKSTSSLTSF